MYDAAVIRHLKALWLASDQMCSKKLVKTIELWMPYYGQECGGLEETTKAKLLRLSAATIDRLLKPVKVRYKQRGMCSTKPGKLLRNVIPIRPDKATMDRQGFIEADTVAHCGNALEGDFAYSVTYADIKSTWTENRAVWGKGAAGVVEMTKEVEESLVFAITLTFIKEGAIIQGMSMALSSRFLKRVLLSPQ